MEKGIVALKAIKSLIFCFRAPSFYSFSMELEVVSFRSTLLAFVWQVTSLASDVAGPSGFEPDLAVLETAVLATDTMGLYV